MASDLQESSCLSFLCIEIVLVIFVVVVVVVVLWGVFGGGEVPVYLFVSFEARSYATHHVFKAYFELLILLSSPPKC